MSPLINILGLVFILFIQNNEPKYWTSLDSVHGKALMMQCSRPAPDNVQAFWKINRADRLVLEQHLKAIRKEKSDYGRDGSVIAEFDSYALQYLGVTIKGQRYIYINALRISKKSADEEYPNWRSCVIRVCDGGQAYWGVLFNLKTKSFEQLYFNGP
ncbi:MAG: hypothetical protein RIG68_12860 [Imperialibacter sp.]|uniref:hypothetical protein n=1 Tax=Imperialibacter sp. TaxID=2038411 RepID=UPI0032EEFF0A